MRLLKPLVSKLTNDEKVIRKVDDMDTDNEILIFLTQLFDYTSLSNEFEHYYGVEMVDLKDNVIGQEILSQFDTTLLRKRDVLAYHYDEAMNTYYFALTDIFNENLRKGIIRSCSAINAAAKFSYAPKEHIVKKYQLLDSEQSNPVLGDNTLTSHTNKLEEVINEGDFNASDWVNDILNKAIKVGASDIHIEPLEEALQVRYRVDGVMTHKKVYSYSGGIISTIFVRMKVISGMDISEKRKAQDGRIDNYQHEGQTFDLRVSTISTVYGEKAVLRLLDKTSETLTFKQLGFTERDEEKVLKMLAKQNGIVYIAGATGSGKTTTLYSMIDVLNEDSINMYTIENPVEKTVDNVNQIQIDELSGITYPSTLRALLRQDPDVIVVGEIRDHETAELSVRSSLTGHLVLSTIHANSALDSISRLMNMGIEPYLIVGSSLGFLSQRLVRRLCSHCKVKKEHLSASEDAWLAEKEAEYGIKIDRNHFYDAAGCENCTEGYKGRVAAVEIVELSDPMKGLILESARSAELEEQALKDGFTPMVLSGISKAQNGLTSIQELIRELN